MGKDNPMATGKKLTIRDIASMAEVSRSTVSLAINNSPLVNAKTKARVLKIIEEVGYRPNAMAISGGAKKHEHSLGRLGCRLSLVYKKIQ